MLRPVNAHVAGDFVYLVLHQVERCDLDVGMHDPGWLRADLQSMPGMWPPTEKGVRKSQGTPPMKSPLSPERVPASEVIIPQYARQSKRMGSPRSVNASGPRLPLRLPLLFRLSVQRVQARPTMTTNLRFAPLLWPTLFPTGSFCRGDHDHFDTRVLLDMSSVAPDRAVAKRRQS